MSALDLKNLGNQSFKDLKFDEALKYYSQAIELTPNDHVLYSNRSGSYASLEQYDEALQDAEKCIELNPAFVKGYQRKGLAQHYLDDYEKAVETYKQGLEKDPNNQALKDGIKLSEERLESESKFSSVNSGNSGYSAYAGGNPFGNPMADALKNPSMQRLLEILQKDPRTSSFASDKSFLQLLSMMMINPSSAGQFMQSDPRLQAAFSVILENPEAQKIFFQDIMSKFKQPAGQPGQPVGGENTTQGSSVETEEEPQIFSEKEDQFQQQQYQQPKQQPRYEAPKYKPQKMEEEKPVDEAEKAKLEGNELYKKKQFEKALLSYDRAIQLKPTEPLYYNNKAACYIETQQYDQALEACQLGLKTMEDNHSNEFTKKAKFFARIGKINWLKGELQEAITFYDKSLLEDQVPAVKDELNRVKREKVTRDSQAYINPQIAEEHNAKGGEAFKAGKFPDALKEYDEAIKRSPKDPKYFCNRATAYMKLMEFNQAVKDLDKCLELDANYVKAYVKKGACHVVFKEFQKAKDIYEKGLKLDPTNQELLQGIEKLRSQIFTTGGTEEEQKMRAQRGMADPEIQQILREPEVINLLQEMQQNPQTAMNAMMKNKDIAGKIEKLIAAGVLKVG